MAIHTGPNVLTDNLSFCVDARDLKTFTGNPLSADYNVFYSGRSWGEVHKASNYGSGAATDYGLVTSGPYKGWYEIEVTSKDTSTQLVCSLGPYGSIPASVQYTVFVEFVSPDGQIVPFLTGSQGSGTLDNIPNTNSWYRTHTKGSAGNQFVYLRCPNSLNGTATVYVRNIIFIPGDKATVFPFASPTKPEYRPETHDFVVHGDVGSGSTFYDSSPNGITLTSYNSPTHAGPGPHGGTAMSFTRASNQFIVSAATDNFDYGTGDFSIDFWFNMNESVTTSTRMHALNIGSSTTNISFDFNDSGYGIWVYWMSGGAYTIRQSGNYYNDGNWHHCMFTRCDGVCRLWVDGVHIGSYTYTSQIGGTLSAYIGGAGSNSVLWDGYIDEVRSIKGYAIWNKSNDYNVPTRRHSNGPLLDRSGNNQDGNFINFGNPPSIISDHHAAHGQVIKGTNDVSFDCTNGGYIDFGDKQAYSNAESFSVEAWFELNGTTGGYFPIISKEGGGGNFGYGLKIDGSVTGAPLVYAIATGSTNRYQYAVPTLSLNTWYHVLATFTSGDINLYLNGVENHSGSYYNQGSFSGTQTTNHLMIGRNYVNAGFNGRVASAKIYNRVLTATEVANNYKNTKGIFGL